MTENQIAADWAQKLCPECAKRQRVEVNWDENPDPNPGPFVCPICGTEWTVDVVTWDDATTESND